MEPKDPNLTDKVPAASVESTPSCSAVNLTEQFISANSVLKKKIIFGMLTDNQVNQVFFSPNNSLSTATFKIKDIYVIAVVLSSHLVSSPTVGELTVTDNHQKLFMEDKKKEEAFYSLQQHQK